MRGRPFPAKKLTPIQLKVHKMVLGENTFVNGISVLDIKSTISARETELLGLVETGKGTAVERIRLGSSLAVIPSQSSPRSCLETGEQLFCGTQAFPAVALMGRRP
jgi:hypothetical protein